MAPIPLKNSSSADLKGRQAAQAVPPLIREPGPSRIVHEALTSSARVLKAAADENHGKTTTSSKKKKTATSPPTGSNIIVNLCSESDSDRELPQNLAELKNSRIKGKGRAKDPDAGLCRQQKHSDDKARTSMEAVDFSQEELDLHLNAIKEKKAGKARAQDTCRRRGKSMLSAAGAGGDNEENGVIVMIGTGNDQVERDCDKHVLDGFPSGKTLDECLQVLLGIFPDMDEGYGKSKLEESFRPGQTSQKLLATTCQILLDGTDGYLKGKKRKAMTQDPSSESSEDECEPRGSNYYEKPLTFVSRKGKMVHQWASVKLLQAEFPHFPLKYLKDLLASNKLSYACTRLEILKMDLFPDRVPSGSTVKGKCKPHAFKPKESGKSHSQSADDNPKGTSFVEWVTGLADLPKDLKSEALWVHGKEGGIAVDKILMNLESTDSSGIECGCCFDDAAPFGQMVQCPEGHLFCKSCAKRAAEEQIGMRKVNLRCMDGDGCLALFSDFEIQRFLPSKTYKLLQRLRQDIDVERAGIEGLEGCPSCSYACVIDNLAEKLFRCENARCGKVSCRACKRDDHLPQSCEEAEDEEIRTRAQHRVEEVLSETLMRRCPKPGCQTPIIKSDGCNKMACPRCNQSMCYVCRQSVPHKIGYSHFSNVHERMGERSDGSKCPLWDNTFDRHAYELEETRTKLGVGVDAPRDLNHRGQASTRAGDLFP